MTFLNLTNGLLWDKHFDGFLRIQSTHCERKMWDRVLLELDSNFLMWLALGKEIKVVDYSANKDVPRALYQGLEWIWFACRKAWNIPVETVEVRGTYSTKYFEQEYCKLSKSVLKKLKYYRKFLNNPRRPEIVSGRTDKDGDYDFFTERAKKFAKGENVVIKTFTWEEHEAVYGMIVDKIPDDVDVYGVCDRYSRAIKAIDGLDWQYEGLISFRAVRPEDGTKWYVVDNEDILKGKIKVIKNNEMVGD